MSKWLLALLFGTAFVLPSCGPMKPNLIVPNVQAGATNQQTLGQTKNATIVKPQAARDVVQSDEVNQVRAENVERVVVNQISWWMMALLFLFWLLPSPSQMGESLGNLVRKVWKPPRGI